METTKLGVPKLQKSLLTYEVSGEVQRGTFAGLAGAICPSAAVTYPPILQVVFTEVLARYNRAMTTLIEQNREWQTDYAYPQNPFVQIDMAGLTPAYLHALTDLNADNGNNKTVGGETVNLLAEDLMASMFEIDGLLTYYGLTALTVPWFEANFRSALNNLREKYGKKIVGLSPTLAQYQEVAHKPHEQMEMYFDGLEVLSADFAVDENAVYYVRGKAASNLLRAKSNKATMLGNTRDYLENDELRRRLKAQTLTTNIGELNDSKAYLPLLNMGKMVTVGDINDALLPTLKKIGGGGRVHYKPCYEVHGSYGSGSVTLTGGGKPLVKLRAAAAKWGTLILQPQLEVPQVMIENMAYIYMDRLYFFNDADTGKVELLGGERTCIPEQSIEGQKRNIHGNKDAIYLPIKL